jgi:hypothetical protein
MVANKTSRSSVEFLAGIQDMIAIDYSGGDVTLARVSRSLGCNVSGTVVMRLEGGSADVTRYMNAGQDYPWNVKIVRNSGTTASMGLYAGY